MKKWTFICNMTIFANQYECDAKDEDEALEMLLNEGLFDNAICTYKFEPNETKCEDCE